MPAAVVLGLVESLPLEAAIYCDDSMRSVALHTQARGVELTFELIRTVMAALGVKRSRLPAPLRLFEPRKIEANVKSPDPRAWGAALGARIVEVAS